jgi:hypothetical protein
MWGWTLFEGLSVAADPTLPTTVTPPYITVKCITGFEFQPLPDSLLSPFVRNSAAPDRKAIDMAAHITHGRMDSLPAAYNSLGALVPSLIAAAPSVLGSVAKIFGSFGGAKRAAASPGQAPQFATISNPSMEPMVRPRMMAQSVMQPRLRSARALVVPRRARTIRAPARRAPARRAPARVRAPLRRRRAPPAMTQATLARMLASMNIHPQRRR